MKLKLSSKRVVPFIAAFVPMTLLLLGMTPAGTRRAPASAEIHMIRPVASNRCRIADSSCEEKIKPHPHDDPLLSHLMTAAISIADHL